MTMRSLILAAALGFADFCSGASPSLRLVFLGDQGPHRPSERAQELIPTLRLHGIAVDYVEDVDLLASPRLADYDGLILYANIDAISPAQEAGLLGYVESGKGFAALHCASYCFRNSQKFVDLVGAQFKSHGGQVFSTRLATNDLAIFRGFGGFASWDETYVHTMHKERDRIVLEYRVEGDHAEGRTSEPWTWIRRQGKGRVFYTAWGHDQRTWTHPGFHNLVERGVRWACGDDELQSVLPFVDTHRFDPPPMVDGNGSVDALEYDDVGNKAPRYVPASGYDGRGEEHHWMQRPLAPETSLGYYVVPKGFQLQLVAAEPDLGPKPIAMNWDDRGRLWVCESLNYPNDLQAPGAGADRVRICEDTDGDGRADKFTVFAENLSIPSAVTFWRGGAIVQNGTETLFLKDTDGDDRADVRRVLIRGWNMRDTHGQVSNFHYGLDNWIWAMQGYNDSHPEYEALQERGEKGASFRMGFFRFRLDANDPPRVTDLEFIRSTNNNTWGLGISEEGLVFGSTANRNPSEFMPIPNRYYERVRGWSAETLQGIADTHLFSPVTEKIRQVDHFGGYTAAAGHALYTARVYPAQWWNKTALVCGPTGHLVGTFVLRRDGAGFKSTSPCNLVASRDAWSAPIMAEVGPDGQVWFIDWYNYIVQHNPTPHGFTTGKGAAYETDLRDKRHGRIYRLHYDASPDAGNAPPVDLPSASPKAWVATLGHPTMLWRLHAQRLLVERGGREAFPELTALVQENSVDAIGLNVAAIHAIGALRGLGAFDANADREAIAALHAALRHRSPGVRRNAIACLPSNDGSRDALLKSGALRDRDAQVQLAAILAISDLPPAPVAAETIASLVDSGAIHDRWLADALTSAAAMQGVDFFEALFQREKKSGPFAPAVVRIVETAAGHLARGRLEAEQLARLLAALERGDDRLGAPLVHALAQAWPTDRAVDVSEQGIAAIAALLARYPLDVKSDLLRLSKLWHAGEIEQLLEAHRTALRAMVADADLTDAERVFAAQAWIGMEPRSEEAAASVLTAAGPGASPQLLGGLLAAAAASRAEKTGGLLIDLYRSLSPAGRQIVVDVMLLQEGTATALLDAIAEGGIDASALRLEQIAALRAYPIEAIRIRAAELIDQQDASPDRDRQKVVNEHLRVADQKGDVERGRALFAKHCAVCHRHKDVGETIGPDLTGMFVHPKQDILTNILDPSRDVEGNYRSYSVVAAGKVYTGLFASESQTMVTLIDAAAKRHAIARSEIDEVFSADKSLMPEGFEKQLAPQDLADVLEFLAVRQQYVPLPLARAATLSTAVPMFGGSGQSADRLILDDWKPRRVENVPFTLVDPREGGVKNAVLLQSDRSASLTSLPSSVRVACGFPAKALHLLSGVSGWGYPAEKGESVSLILRLHYADQQTEEHALTNGVHFADYIRRVDVTGSTYAFAMGGQQMRYLSIIPQRPEKILEIELVKGSDSTVPIVLAITAEVRE